MLQECLVWEVGLPFQGLSGLGVDAWLQTATIVP